MFVTALAGVGEIVARPSHLSQRPGWFGDHRGVAFVGAVALLLRKWPRMMIGWFLVAIGLRLARGRGLEASRGAIDWLKSLIQA